MSDYNEMLISQAGGDGPEKMVDVAFTIFSHNDRVTPHVERLHFTNLPMSRVKDAIDLLNDDHVELIPTPRTEDFSMDELFGRGFGERYSDYESNTGNHEWFTTLYCKECGASVVSPAIHIRWHNKLLP